jgi:hypothetical protein
VIAGATYLDDPNHLAGVTAYLRSLRNVKDCVHAMVCQDVQENLELVELAAECDVGLIWIDDLRIRDDFYWMGRDRHRLFLWFLKSFAYDQVIVTDCRDVIFQTDVQPLGGLHLVAEGMLYRESEWNTRDVSRVPEESIKGIENSLVLNGGIQAGSRVNLIALYERFAQAVGRAEFAESTSEQGVLNVLHYRNELGDTKIHSPYRSTLCLTGEAIKLGLFEDYTFEDGLFRNAEGVPYQIVHQWDRTPHSGGVDERYRR